jgi:ABC-2 type transport system permease protein
VSQLRRYWLLYREFISTCLTEALTYRINFILLVLMDIAFYVSTLASTSFIFDHTTMIGSWGRNEFMFFVAFMLAVDQLHMSFVSESFWNFSADLRTGKLDFILIKPVWTLFPIFFRMLRPGSLLNLPVTSGFLIYYGLEVGLTAKAWALLPLFVVLALALLVSIEILIAMTMFWTVESWSINFLRMQFQQLSRWPDFVYRYFAQKMFTIIIPVLLVGSVPVKILLGETSAGYILTMALAMLICWILIKIMWRVGLKGYESASS